MSTWKILETSRIVRTACSALKLFQKVLIKRDREDHYQTIFRKIHNKTGYGIDIGAFPDKTNGEFSPTFLGLFY